MSDTFFDELCGIALSCGADHAAVVPVEKVETDASFRKLCESNACGNYGKNWRCPPYAGGIDDLIAELRSYRYMLVYQSIGRLEDSYDFEGMMAAGERHSGLTKEFMRKTAGDARLGRHVNLGAGGCRICPTCAKRDDLPCRHPDRAVTSMEAYGVNVSRLAAAAGMKYINGTNTVTYFSGLLFDGAEESHE